MSKEPINRRVAFEYGYAVRVGNEKAGQYPVFGSNGVTGYIDNFKEKGPGVIIGRKGSVGKVVYSEENFTPTDTSYFLRILDTNRDCLKFWYYFLSVLGLEKLNTHSAVPGLSRELAYLIEVQLPKIETQQKIAAVLTALDAKIDCNNRINAELETMARTLYDYWFVQFDFPDTNGNPYKTAGGKMTYNPTLKREIPAGWQDVPLSDWIAADKTGDWGKDTAQGNYTLQVNCIRGADINSLNGAGTIEAPARFILEKNKTKLLAPFDFVVEISGGSPTQSTGRLAPITIETFNRFANPPICSNFCKVISLKENAYFFNFAYLWKSAYDNQILFGWEGKTSGIKNLLFDSFVEKHFVSKPPKNLAQKFFDFLNPLENKKQKLMQENHHLAQLRDWLLPLLMNGQVTPT